jgi:hypothetical protein
MGVVLYLPGETEIGTAGEQPNRAITGPKGASMHTGTPVSPSPGKVLLPGDGFSVLKLRKVGTADSLTVSAWRLCRQAIAFFPPASMYPSHGSRKRRGAGQRPAGESVVCAGVPLADGPSEVPSSRAVSLRLLVFHEVDRGVVHLLGASRLGSTRVLEFVVGLVL